MIDEILAAAIAKKLSGGGGGGGSGAVDDVLIDGSSIVQNGVANVPVASSSVSGVIRVLDGDHGARVTNGFLQIASASDSDIKSQSNSYRSIVPNRQHNAVFYGLAKAAGDSTQSASSNSVGTYTESAKSAITQMISGAVSVSGTTPSIDAKPGVRYICGEVAELDITVPATGIIDVIFTSGTTPTVLTVTPPTGVTIKWMGDFDPTSLDADTTYEINIMDGQFGVVGSWT